MFGWGGLPAILSGLVALFLLACAVSIAANECGPKRGALFGLAAVGGLVAAALFFVFLVTRILADAATILFL